MEVLKWIFEKLGIGKLPFLNGLTTDKLTTWLGFLQGILTAAATYMATGFDPTNALSWAGLGVALTTYIKSVLTKGI